VSLASFRGEPHFLLRGRSRNMLAIPRGRFFQLLPNIQGNFIGKFQLRENLLAARATGDVRFPEGEFRRNENPFVITGQNFRIGAGIGSGIGISQYIRFRSGRRAGTQMPLQSFFENSIAVFRRHGSFHS